MNSNSFDLIVIGAGPGGYVAAIRAAQLGMSVACIEKSPTLGGTCLNVGCIPSKALLESSELYWSAKHKFSGHGIVFSEIELQFQKMMDRKKAVVLQLTKGVEGLFKKNKITRFYGTASFQSDKTVQVKTVDQKTELLSAKNILIATGSEPISIPNISIDHQFIIDSTDALSLQKVPDHLVVMGGGYIGLELGSVYFRLGSQVTIVEAMDRILPGMDREISQSFHKIIQKEGMKVLTETKVIQASPNKEGVQLLLEGKGGEKQELNADLLLVSVGRKPYFGELELEKIGLKPDEKGRLSVNDQFETSVKGIYAVGDIIRGPMLAHKASEEGVAVAEILAGEAGHVNYATIPGVVYTHPEIATVGLTEEEAKQKGFQTKSYKFPLLANGRAIALGEKEGWVKLVADQKTDRLLGAHLIAARASDLISELVLALEFSASAEDIARTVHAHPTLSESVKEAALGLGTGALHF